MIYEPALAVGMRFESNSTGETLDQVLLEKASKYPESLPLLEFILNELYKECRMPDRMLTFKAYEKLGGLEGALAKRAEEVYEDFAYRFGKVFLTFFPAIFRALATVETGSEEMEVVVRRYEKWETLASSPERQEFLMAMIEARLLVTDRMNDESAIVRVAHEALFWCWPRLKELLEKDRDFLHVRARVTNALVRWKQEKKNSDLLLQPGLSLAEAKHLLEKRPEELETEAQDFIKASLNKAARQQRIRMAVVAGVFLLILGTVVFSFFQARITEKQRNKTLHNESLLLADKSKQATENGNRILGIKLALQALPKNIKQPDRPYVAEAENSLYKALYCSKKFQGRVILKGHKDLIRSTAYSPDGERILTISNDGTVRVWDAESGKELAVLDKQQDYNSAVFSPDGKRIVTASFNASIWDATTGKELLAFDKHQDIVYSAVFSPDGKRIITTSRDLTARVWDAENGKELVVFNKHQDYVYIAAFSPNGKRIVTASYYNARIWDAESGKELAVLDKHQDIVYTAAFSPDGKRIVTASKDYTARVWDHLIRSNKSVL
jgi:hypothetical protein